MRCDRVCIAQGADLHPRLERALTQSGCYVAAGVEEPNLGPPPLDIWKEPGGGGLGASGGGLDGEAFASTSCALPLDSPSGAPPMSRPSRPIDWQGGIGSRKCGAGRGDGAAERKRACQKGFQNEPASEPTASRPTEEPAQERTPERTPSVADNAQASAAWGMPLEKRFDAIADLQKRVDILEHEVRQLGFRAGEGNGVDGGSSPSLLPGGIKGRSRTETNASQAAPVHGIGRALCHVIFKPWSAWDRTGGDKRRLERATHLVLYYSIWWIMTPIAWPISRYLQGDKAAALPVASLLILVLASNNHWRDVAYGGWRHLADAVVVLAVFIVNLASMFCRLPEVTWMRHAEVIFGLAMPAVCCFGLAWLRHLRGDIVGGMFWHLGFRQFALCILFYTQVIRQPLSMQYLFSIAPTLLRVLFVGHFLYWTSSFLLWRKAKRVMEIQDVASIKRQLSAQPLLSGDGGSCGVEDANDE